MITFNRLGSYGRLGNQLFQYAILKSVSIKTGYEIVLPKDIYKRSWHGQKCPLDNFILKSAILDNQIPNHNFKEPSHDMILDGKRYHPEVYKVKDNTNFLGWFQSPKYYEDIKNELIEEIQLKPIFVDYAKDYLSKFNNTTVSLHVRRGDVSDGSNKGCQWANDFSENSIQFKYYTEVLSLIPKDSTILLFTGGSRENDLTKDIMWCKEKFNDERIIFVGDLDEIRTFSLMTNVDINIMGFKSTFSWWGSFLNKKSVVYAPKNFNPTRMDIGPELVYPSDWIII
jgi:hypothetical protein